MNGGDGDCVCAFLYVLVVNLKKIKYMEYSMVVVVIVVWE